MGKFGKEQLCQQFGMFTKSEMFAGDTLTESKIAPDYESIFDAYERLDGSQVIYSSTITSFAGGISGKIESGDLISFIVKSEGKYFIPDELKYVQVITTTAANGLDTDEVPINEDGSVALPATVTLFVTPKQACVLAKYEGALHAVLAYRGDIKTMQKYLDEQNEILDEIEGEQNG